MCAQVNCLSKIGGKSNPAIDVHPWLKFAELTVNIFLKDSCSMSEDLRKYLQHHPVCTQFEIARSQEISQKRARAK